MMMMRRSLSHMTVWLGGSKTQTFFHSKKVNAINNKEVPPPIALLLLLLHIKLPPAKAAIGNLPSTMGPHHPQWVSSLYYYSPSYVHHPPPPPSSCLLDDIP